MAYRTRSRGQFTAPSSRSGKSYVYGGRRVLLREGNFQLNWDSITFLQEVLDAVANAFQALSVQALEYMRSIVPVDTGELRESCYVIVDTDNGKLRLEVGAGAAHAVYVELGTFKMPAQPYIRPTFDMVIRLIPEILNSEMARRVSR